MAATYRARTTTDEVYWSQETSVAAITGHPNLDHVAALTLWNPTGSGKVVTITEVAMSPLGTVTASTPATLSMIRTTAMTNESAVTPVAMDTNSAALPSQVVATSTPLTVTTAYANINRTAMLPARSMTVVLQDLASRRPGARLAPGNLWNWKTHTDGQKLVLRESEGVALQLSGSLYAMVVQWDILFRVVATGATWLATGTVGLTDLSLCGLFNGSGSGVVLEVVSVQLTEWGEAVAPQYTLEYVDAAAITSGIGTALTPVSMDTTNTLGTIAAYKNANVKTAGAKSGALIAMAHKQRVMLPDAGRGPALGGNLVMGIREGYLFRALHSDRVMVIREGKGLALIQRNTGSVGRAEMVMQFSVADAGAGGGVQPVVRAFA